MEMRNTESLYILSTLCQGTLLGAYRILKDPSSPRGKKVMETKPYPLRGHTFTFEYPKEAADAILRNTDHLEKLIPNLGWQIEIFAGYSLLPEGYKSFDSSQLSALQGTAHNWQSKC